VSNGFITPFIKMGEGAFEALSRIGGNAAVVTGTFKNMGIETNITGLGLISFSENMVDLYESSYKAGDGLKNFINVMNNFYKLTNTIGEQSAMSIESLVKRITEINTTSVAISSEAGKIGIEIPEIKLSTPTVGTKDETIKELKEVNKSLTTTSLAISSVVSGLGSLKSTIPLNFGSEITYDQLKKVATTDTQKTFINRLMKLQPDVSLITSLDFDKIAKTLDVSSFKEKSSSQTKSPVVESLVSLITANEKSITTNTSRFNEQRDVFFKDSTKFITEGYVNSAKELVKPFANVTEGVIPQLKSDLTAIFKMTDVRAQATAYDALISKYGAISNAIGELSKSVVTTQDGLTGLTDTYKSVSDVYESILGKTTTQLETQTRANTASLIGLDYQTKVNDAIPLVIDNILAWQKSLSDAEKASYKITDVNTVTAMSLKAFDNTIVKTAASIESFKKSVSDWVLGKMTTTVGSPESQFNASKVAFESMLSILNNPNANSATDVANAQSKITGYADTFITNIQKMYGAGDVGANLVQDVVNKVSNLGAVDYQTTMLEKTTQIADNTAKMADKATSTTTDAATTKALDSVSALTTVVNDIIAAPTGIITLDPYAVTANPSWSNISVSEMATVKPAANDSSTNTAETIAELKLSNEQLAQLVVETRALVTVQAEANATVVAQLTDLVSTSQEDTLNNRMRALAG
jgi:hypothetical protein